MRKRIPSNQDGIVSILVTMIMILVISLIVIGFAQITRRNARENLDNQLSTQAFYAAETGINDAKPLIQALASATSITDCNGLSALGQPTTMANLDTANNVSYTCLNFNNQPSNLKYQSIPENSSVTVPILTNASPDLSFLKFSWDANSTGSTDSSNCSTGDQLRPKSGGTSWNCAYGLLRLDLVQAGAGTDPATLQQKTITIFIKPSNGDLSRAVNFNGTGIIFNVHCTTGTCNATVNLPAGAGANFYARVTAVYQGLQNVTITGPVGINFKSAQATIDVTGKAQDVLRRIQVHIPLTSTNTEASAALQTTGSICKLLAVLAPDVNDDCAIPEITAGTPAGGSGANFISCQGGSCASASTPSLSWDYTFKNTSTNAPGSVDHCIWNFGDALGGDATPTTAANPNQACNAGQTISHTFSPNTSNVTTCHVYTITLTIYLTSSKVETKSQSLSLPYGTSAPTTCT